MTRKRKTAKLTFTALKAQLDATWREQPHKVRVAATRYYLGAETLESLRALARPKHCSGDYMLPPVLTESQVEHIIQLR
jgi:hypothetical protein